MELEPVAWVTGIFDTEALGGLSARAGAYQGAWLIIQLSTCMSVRFHVPCSQYTCQNMWLRLMIMLSTSVKITQTFLLQFELLF